MKRLQHVIFATLTLGCGCLSLIAAAGSLEGEWAEDSYYADWPLFHPYPDETKPSAIARFGPVGIGIDLTLPAFGMKIRNVERDSPADATGKLKKGQVIESVNGRTLKDIDPRVFLGGIITQAEATDGLVRLRVRDNQDAPVREVTVKIPVLGTYSRTWPLNCPKSEQIVRRMADYLAKSGNQAGPGIKLGLLFLLSTGDAQDLAVARGWIQEVVAKYKDAETIDVYPWHAGYSGPGLCEYYLRTGDASILPVIEKMADSLKRTIYNAGWSGRGGLPFTYMGGGHMNAAGVHCVTFLMLAKECGVKVDETALQESLKQFYRYAGHNNTPYGDGIPEGGFVDNGKVGGLAFAMAAAATLTPDGEQSVYARARDISAVKGFYSTSWMLHGHTGGGIGEIWRSASMGLMVDKKPTKYREFMNRRMWFYELSRRYDGSFGIVGGERYDGKPDSPGDWGVGLALTYTIPRRTLRITGAPTTKYCHPYELPKRPWGTAADETFYSLEPAPDKDGRAQDVDSEKLPTDASWPILRRVRDPNVTDEVLLMYARHPDSGIRQQTVDSMVQMGRDHLILDLLNDRDPRGRSSGAEAIYGTFKRRPLTPDRLTDEMVRLLFKMVEDPSESMWGAQNAMMALSLSKPDLIVPHVDRLTAWIRPDDWWVSTAAMFALTPVVADQRCYKQVLPAIGGFLARNARWGSNAGGRAWVMPGIMKQLKGAAPEVQGFALDVLAKAYSDFPANLTVPGGIDMQPVVDYKLHERAGDVVQLPGGFDRLYEISRKRFPEQSLPHEDLYRKADPAGLGAKVRAALAAEAAAEEQPPSP